MSVKLNINDQVSVKLTDAGKARWRGLFGRTPPYFVVVPLWELMQMFGPGLHMGMTDMYFVDNEIEVLINEKQS